MIGDESDLLKELLHEVSKRKRIASHVLVKQQVTTEPERY